MAWIRRAFSALSVDGWALGLTGLVAIGIGLLDFTPLITITTDPALRMILVSLGLLMAATVAQAARRTADFSALRNAAAFTHVELVGEAFVLHARQNIEKAKRFVLDTTLSAEYASNTLKHPSDNASHFYYTIRERLQKRDLVYRRVEVIFNQERLRSVVFRLLVHEGLNYYIRYYDPPPQPIPVLNLLSIDNESFYLGGFPTSDGQPDYGQLAYIQSPQLGELLKEYWDTLWYSAKPLNEGGRINWDELRSIAGHVGMSAVDFDSLVETCRNDAERPRRRRG